MLYIEIQVVYRQIFIQEDKKMSGKYQGTQTEKNLQAAFAGESQARN